MLSRSYPSRCLASNLRPMSRLAVPGRCRVVRARVDVESSRLGSMSSLPGLGRCWVVQARVDVESSEPESMSSRLSPGRCRVFRARAYFGLSGSGPMLSRPVSGCRVVRTLVDVEPSWSTSKLSRVRPSLSQVSLVSISKCI